ncbi:MAG: ribosome biogenesis GTP-binding protein YihA/YsxC [Candidatus Paceibacterota bacterium]
MISHIKNKTNKNQKDTIFSSEFIKGTIGEDKIFFDNRDQIAFIGRSNVGKSSVINTLVNKKNLAKSSSLPGKTKEINFFLINLIRNRGRDTRPISNGTSDQYYFVDLPGYGYAKVPTKVADKLRKRIIWYFSELKTKPRFVVFITDSNIGVTKLDEEMLEILENENHSVIVIANKSDKLSQNQIFKNVEEIKEKLKNYKCVKNVILFSTKTKKGREEVLNILLK